MIFRLLCSSDLTTKLEVYKPPLLQPSSFPYLVGEGFGDFKICGGSESSYLLHLSEALSIFKPGNLETVVEVFGLFLKIEVISDREGRGEMTATFTMTTKAPSHHPFTPSPDSRSLPPFPPPCQIPRKPPLIPLHPCPRIPQNRSRQRSCHHILMPCPIVFVVEVRVLNSRAIFISIGRLNRQSISHLLLLFFLVNEISGALLRGFGEQAGGI
jgi:hypothetical protein